MSKREMNPRSLKNLKPIKRGQVLNPLGINVKKRPITDEHWQASGELIPEKLVRRFNKEAGAELLRPGDTWARGVAIRAAYIGVMDGVVKAMKEIRESCEGRSPQRLEITGAPAKTEHVLIVKYEDRRGRLHDSSEAMRAADDAAKSILTN
jgi:hypothetical protein